jgi:MtN3 and saliva related transmembrane protein
MLNRDELAWLNAYHAQVRRKIAPLLKGASRSWLREATARIGLTLTECSWELWVSALAAILTTAAFVPQALHIIRHRETKAISLVMYVAFASGVALWLVFGVLIGNWAIIVSNAITLVLTLAIVGMKIRYG